MCHFHSPENHKHNKQNYVWVFSTKFIFFRIPDDERREHKYHFEYLLMHYSLAEDEPLIISIIDEPLGQEVNDAWNQFMSLLDT